MESGIEKMVARIEDDEGPFFTIKQVADRLGVSKDTVRRRGTFLGIPSHKMELCDPPKENAFVWLYTESDIAELNK
jgi:hypothetical protein